MTASEQAVQQLAQAYGHYVAAYRAAASAVYTPTPAGPQRVADLEHIVGPERVAHPWPCAWSRSARRAL